MRIYLAGPISSDPERHHENAVNVANEIIDLGHNPYVPNLVLAMERKKPRDYETWMALDEDWLRQCDALYRIPGESPGADREMKVAQKLGLIIFRDITDIPPMWTPERTVYAIRTPS